MLLAVVPLAAGHGLWRLRSWSRGPAVITQLLMLPVAGTLATSGGAWPAAALGLGGSALAVLKHAHMGVPEIVRMLPPGARIVAAVFAQLCTMAFFVLLAWVGYSILDILASDRLVSLPQVSVAFAMSAIPIGAALFVLGQLLVFPEVMLEARGEEMRVEESE